MIKEKLVTNEDYVEDLELGACEKRSLVNDNDQWLDVFSKMIKVLKHIFLSPQRSRFMKYLYYMLTVLLLLLGIVLPIFMGVTLTEDDDHYDEASSAYMTFFHIQFIIYLYFPFYYYPLMKDIFNSKDVKVLLKEAIAVSSFKSLQLKFNCIYFINMGVTTTSMVIYIYFRDANWVTLLFTIAWFIFYIFPLSAVFGFIVSILEAHRIQVTFFKEQLVVLRRKYEASRPPSMSLHEEEGRSFAAEVPRGVSVRAANTDMTVFRDSNSSGVENESRRTLNQRKHVGTSEEEAKCTEVNDQIPLLLTVEDITQHYLRLHDAFHLTSDKRGFFIFSTFLLPLLIIMSSIWSIYEDFFSFQSTIGYIVMSIFYLLEVGLMVATVNETGNLVSREISSFLIRVLVNSSVSYSGDESLSATLVNKINGFVSCLLHIRIEIPFFGNFTLRSRTLLAIMASLLGATIPGIIRNAM
jgi:hypothetical protein